MHNNRRVCPLILTCGRNLSYVQQFVSSYTTQASKHLPPPMIIVDISAGPLLPGPYVNLLARLQPRGVTIHSRPQGLSVADSVQHAAFFALREAVGMLNDNEDHVMFMEDDIVFSRQFAKAVEEARYDKDMAFYTFYQPHDGYGDDGVVSSDFIHKGYFYGTQCLMFPVETVKLLLGNQELIEQNYPPGYDLRWSRFLDHQKRIAYHSKRSYVQHIGSNSRLGCMQHTANTFVE